GGAGTLEEIFEVFTWTQLRFHEKPCAFLDVDGYYAPLFDFLDHMAEQQFIKREHVASLIRRDDAVELLKWLRDYTPVTVEKWMGRKAEKSGQSKLRADS